MKKLQLTFLFGFTCSLLLLAQVSFAWSWAHYKIVNLTAHPIINVLLKIKCQGNGAFPHASHYFRSAYFVQGSGWASFSLTLPYGKKVCQVEKASVGLLGTSQQFSSTDTGTNNYITNKSHLFYIIPQSNRYGSKIAISLDGNILIKNIKLTS